MSSEEELNGIVDLVRRFAFERIDPISIDREHHIPTDLLDQLANLGVFGLSVPEPYGGLGLEMGPICEVIATLAERDRSVATTVGLHLGLGTRGMIAFASDDLKRRILPRMATGEHIAAFAATEPGAGSDLRAVSTRAVESDGGLVVNGQKIFVTNGGLARIYTILAATPGMGGRRRGFSLLWLDRDDPGLTVGPEEGKLGLRGSSTTSLHLDDLEICSDRIIGEAGRGMEQMTHVLAWGRTAMASGCVGAAKTALLRANRHTLRRVQFGGPLSSQAVIQAQLADLAALHFAMRAMVRHTARARTPTELEERSLATKVVCSEGNWEICDRTVQLFGGIGYIEETGIPLLLRDARITRIFEGANEVLIARLGALAATTQPSLPSVADDWARATIERIDTRRAEIVATHGLKLLRQPRLLAQLGHLAVHRQSIVAVFEQHSSPIAAELAAHWLHRCERAMAPHLEDPPDPQRARRIAEFYVEEARV